MRVGGHQDWVVMVRGGFLTAAGLGFGKKLFL